MRAVRQGGTDMDLRIDRMHAEFCKAAANPVRLRILTVLAQTPRSVGSLAKALGLSMPTVSKNLKVLREQDVVSGKRHGNVILYRIEDREFLRAVALIRKSLLHRLRTKGKLLTSSGTHG